jgi:hypothetical protein
LRINHFSRREREGHRGILDRITGLTGFNFYHKGSMT